MMKAASLAGSSLIAKKPADVKVSPPVAVVTKSDVAAKPIAMTLKLDQDRYEALKTLQAKQRKTGQQILIEALDRYLEAYQ
jgi:hypothetical protein